MALWIYTVGGKDARNDLKEKDRDRAASIRNRARTLDERVRDYDDAGWRD
ncbi:MAG: hypothetical protein VKL39_07075 [Leptolyngbyaceae bacterium]|nr:hypothetical protein [Leptolyngbyaceae bacterium]